VKRRLLVALIAVAVIIIALAYGVQIATPPTPSLTPEVTPTIPAPAPAPIPYMPAFKVEFDPASSYGFDRIYSTWLGAPVFEISRGKSATLIVKVTSAFNKTLDISLKFEGVPVGVEVKMEPERFTLQPNEQITLKLTITVSQTAPTSTPKPPQPTPTETPTPGGPTPLPTPGAPETPTATPTPEPPIPADFIELYFSTPEPENFEIGLGFLLSIV